MPMFVEFTIDTNHREDKRVAISIDQIMSFCANPSGNGSIISSIDGAVTYCVTETYEEIMQALEAIELLSAFAGRRRT